VVLDSFREWVGYTARNPRWVPGSNQPKWHHGVKISHRLYNLWAARDAVWRSGTVILCEGPGDVLRWFEAGYPCAVAALGSTLLDGQFGGFHLLLSDNVRCYIAADNDEAGRKFAQQAQNMLSGAFSNEIKVVLPPRGKDFGELRPEEIRALGLPGCVQDKR
jgi:DNA primase